MYLQSLGLIVGKRSRAIVGFFTVAALSYYVQRKRPSFQHVDSQNLQSRANGSGGKNKIIDTTRKQPYTGLFGDLPQEE